MAPIVSRRRMVSFDMESVGVELQRLILAGKKGVNLAKTFF
jgi:hypothetical protein